MRELKKVALISVQANSVVRRRAGSGILETWTAELKEQVIQDSLKTMENYLKTLGWEVVPWSRVSADAKNLEKIHRVFHEGKRSDGSLFEQVNPLTSLAVLNPDQDPGWFTALGFELVLWNPDDHPGDRFREDQLGAISQALGVDAVFTAQYDFCYQSSPYSIAGSGEAIMTAGLSIQGVDRFSRRILSMRPLPICGGEDRGESRTGAPMIGGGLFPAKDTAQLLRQMFAESSAEATRVTLKNVSDAIR